MLLKVLHTATFILLFIIVLFFFSLYFNDKMSPNSDSIGVLIWILWNSDSDSRAVKMTCNSLKSNVGVLPDEIIGKRLKSKIKDIGNFDK